MESIFDSHHYVHLKVDFYDDEEKRKLLQYPTSEQITKIVASGVTVPMAQFLTYYYFHRKRPELLGYRNYAEISKHIDKAKSDIEDFIDYQEGSLISRAAAHPPVRSITENIGEAATLSLMGEIHDLHDADWQHIKERRGRGAPKVFDYEDIAIGSDGKFIVQVEAKGTAVKDTATLSINEINHKKNIDDKKTKIRMREKEGTYDYPADLRYGVICSIGQRGPLHCRLTDPPTAAESDPRRYRLLRRLEFMFGWISFLKSKSQLAASFATRLRALQALNNPFLLANVPLLQGDGTEFEFAYDPLGRSEGIFASLCRVTDGPAVGTVVKLENGQLFFLGVRREIFDMAAKQTFNRIMIYKNFAASVRKTIRCVIPISRARQMGIAQYGDTNSQSPTISFNAEGVLHYSQGGMVFGVITPTRMGKRS